MSRSETKHYIAHGIAGTQILRDFRRGCMDSAALKYTDIGTFDYGQKTISPLLRTPALERISLAPAPQKPTALYRWLMSGTLTVAWLGSLPFVTNGIEPEYLLRLGIGFPVIVMGLAWHYWVGEHARSRMFQHSLDAPLRELKDLHRFLENYQNSLDARTSKYFHCVTSTKVSAYFALTQLRQGVYERVHLVEKLLATPTNKNLLRAFELLRGTMIFSDGVMPNSGTMRLVPVSKIGGTVAELIEGLEEGLLELEDEIQFRVPPSNDDKEDASDEE